MCVRVDRENRKSEPVLSEGSIEDRHGGCHLMTADCIRVCGMHVDDDETLARGAGDGRRPERVTSGQDGVLKAACEWLRLRGNDPSPNQLAL